MDVKALASKKVFNIPVVYIAGAAVLVLAYFAWKMKTTNNDTSTDPGTEPDAGTSGAAADNADAYSGLNAAGTVTVVQGATAAQDAAQPTNEDWARSAINWLIGNNKATATEAQVAIDHYLSGNDLSYDESKLINAAIASKEIGQPPDKIAIGNVGTTPPGQKQFNNFPGRHTVKGGNDNTPAKLAQLYYGASDANHANKIASANPDKGPVTTTYSAGTTVTIPEWVPPKYYTVTGSGDTRASTVAAKNGTSTGAIRALNPGLTELYKKGTKVRYV